MFWKIRDRIHQIFSIKDFWYTVQSIIDVPILQFHTRFFFQDFRHLFLISLFFRYIFKVVITFIYRNTTVITIIKFFFSLLYDYVKKKKNKKNSCLQRENLTITLSILLLKWHHFKIIEFVLDFLQLRFEVNNSFDVFLFSSMFRQNLDHYKDKKKICLWRNSRLFRHSDTQFKISLMHEYQAFLELLNSHLKIAKIHGIFTHF